MPAPASSSAWYCRLLRVQLRGSARSLPPWLVFVALAALLGSAFGNTGVQEANQSALRIAGISWVEQVQWILLGLLATFAVIAAIDLVCRDQEEAWLLPLIAAGSPRWIYAAAAVSTLVTTHLIVYFTASAAYGVALHARGVSGGLDASRAVPAAAYLVSATCYGFVFGVLLRRRVAAIVAAVSLLGLPYLVALAWFFAHGAPLRASVRRLLFAYAPPPAPGWSDLWEHGVYVAVVLTIVLLLAQRFLGKAS